MEPKECEKCEGTGIISWSYQYGDDDTVHGAEECWACDGTGKVPLDVT